MLLALRHTILKNNKISDTRRAPEADLMKHFFSNRRMLRVSQDNKYEKKFAALTRELSS